MMSSFKYTPFSEEDNSIRLLALKSGAYDCEIEIELFPVPVWQGDPPDYEALSYVWGSTEDRRRIAVREWSAPDLSKPLSESLYGDPRKLVSEGQLPVTQNLEVALRYLRRPTSHRVLWIDAICIDQENMEERSFQVQRMGRIYHAARQVVIWLGPGNETSPLAVEALRIIGTDSLFKSDEHLMYSLRESTTKSFKIDTLALKKQEAEWLAIQELLQRKWFTRLWVYQEYQMSKQAMILVGSLQLNWEKFVSAVFWIRKSPAYLNSGLHILDNNLMNPMYGLAIGSDVPTATVVMHQTRHKQCFDPRDRVYAILGVTETIHNNRFKIVPDYTKSVEEVYEEFNTAVILSTDDLHILRFVSSPKANSNMPTWVADLSDMNACGPIIPSEAAGRVKNTASNSVFVKNSDLNVTGLITDTLAHCLPPVSLSAKVPEIATCIQSWEPKDLLTASYVGGSKLQDAFLKTILCGRLLENFALERGVAPSLEYIKTAYQTVIWGAPSEEANAKFISSLFHAVLGRKFCRTEKGFMGMFPADAKVGDQVWVVLGSDLPLLLREVKVPWREGSLGEYQLLGCCYVAGIMHGESLFGQLPSGWSTLPRNNVGLWTFVHENGMRTSQDPRLDPLLGPLPHGWKVCYEDDEIMNEEDGPNRFWFSHPEHDYQWYDPRLSKENLLRRGVQLKDITIV
jgi:hypothetical protein